MAWTNSRVFRPFLESVFKNTAAFDLDGDSFKAALYNNSITPDNDVSAANSAYNVDQWGTANELYEVGQWAQAGVALTTPVIDVSSADVVFWDADDTASGSGADITNAVGTLVYDDTLTTPVADQGVCYLYFGGAFTSTNGTFTVSWPATGLWRATLT